LGPLPPHFSSAVTTIARRRLLLGLLTKMQPFTALALLHLAAFVAGLPRAPASIVLSSSQSSYIVDLQHGCSISAAWAEGDPAKTNLINTADLGRYVQVLRLLAPRAAPW
jgi:hypothetical protein